MISVKMIEIVYLVRREMDGGQVMLLLSYFITLSYLLIDLKHFLKY